MTVTANPAFMTILSAPGFVECCCCHVKRDVNPLRIILQAKTPVKIQIVSSVFPSVYRINIYCIFGVRFTIKYIHTVFAIPVISHWFFFKRDK